MIRRDMLRLAGAALATLTVPIGPAAACRVFPPDGTFAFRAERDGQPVGRHEIVVSRSSGVLVVRSETVLAATLRGGRPYHLTQRVEESWDEGWLSGLVADTEEDGRQSRVRARRDRSGVFGGVANGHKFTVSGYPITTTLWHRDTPSQRALLDVSDAHVKLIRGWLLDEERIAAGGDRVNARHYAIRGEINREVWYDPDCLLVRAALYAPDGARLLLSLQ